MIKFDNTLLHITRVNRHVKDNIDKLKFIKHVAVLKNEIQYYIVVTYVMYEIINA